MSVRVLNPGATFFTKRCPRCDCIFEHELGDLEAPCPPSLCEACGKHAAAGREKDVVKCPECGCLISHLWAKVGKVKQQP